MYRFFTINLFGIIAARIFAHIRGHVIIISGSGAAACALRLSHKGATWNATVLKPVANTVYPRKRRSFVHECMLKDAAKNIGDYRFLCVLYQCKTNILHYSSNASNIYVMWTNSTPRFTFLNKILIFCTFKYAVILLDTIWCIIQTQVWFCDNLRWSHTSFDLRDVWYGLKKIIHNWFDHLRSDLWNDLIYFYLIILFKYRNYQILY